MYSFLWVFVPIGVAFVACWAGIPLYLTLTHWHRETEAKHAEIAARAAPVLVQVPEQATEPVFAGTGSPAYSELASRPL